MFLPDSFGRNLGHGIFHPFPCNNFCLGEILLNFGGISNLPWVDRIFPGLRPELPPQAGYFQSQTGTSAPETGNSTPVQQNFIFYNFCVLPLAPLGHECLPPLLLLAIYLCCAGACGSSHPARKKACAGRGSRPPRLDREDSGSSSGGQVEPPKRSRSSRGKAPYQSVMELNQADFRTWRSAFNYDEPQDPDIDNCFWSPQMEKLHRDLYSQLSDLKKVCPIG